ncbi:MAG: RDD family protein [Campylobacterota bacterium]|nr:RDD family protein [Campylobacterota bacterium]
MAQQRRFRDVKQKKPLPYTTGEEQSKIERKDKLPYASIGNKTKAFITDSFMLLMPIMYIVAYFVMDGLQEFSQNKVEGWITILIPNFIVVSLFFWKSGQTPGCRAYNIRLVDSKTGREAHPLAIALRYYFEIISIVTIVGLMMAYFRRDRKCLHDLLSGTVLIDTEKS